MERAPSVLDIALGNVTFSYCMHRRGVYDFRHYAALRSIPNVHSRNGSSLLFSPSRCETTY